MFKLMEHDNGSFGYKQQLVKRDEICISIPN